MRPYRQQPTGLEFDVRAAATALDLSEHNASCSGGCGHACVNKIKVTIYCTETGCKEVSCLKCAMLRRTPKDPWLRKVCQATQPPGSAPNKKQRRGKSVHDPEPFEQTIAREIITPPLPPPIPAHINMAVSREGNFLAHVVGRI